MKTPLQQNIPSPEWYRNIVTLPLKIFITCIVDKNISALTISGFPSQKDLVAAWANIQLEYADTIGSSEHKMYLQALWEYERTSARLTTILDMVEMLRKIYFPDFLRILNRAGRTAFKLDWTNQPEYNATLDKAVRRTAGIKIDLELQRMDLEGIKPKEDQIAAPTREYYQKFLITLSDFAKYPIHDDITVFEFCERVHRYTQYCEQVEKAAGK